MFLRNHGVVACGSTVEEAYHYAVNVMSACQTQVICQLIFFEFMIYCIIIQWALYLG
jgi:adducin